VRALALAVRALTAGGARPSRARAHSRRPLRLGCPLAFAAGSTSPTHLGAPRAACCGGDSVGENIYGALASMGDTILRCVRRRGGWHTERHSQLAVVLTHACAPRSNSAGLLDDIPLSQWEQLVGLFDVRARARVRLVVCAGATGMFRHMCVRADTRTFRPRARRAAARAQEDCSPRYDEADSAPALGRLSLCDVAADEVLPLPSDFAAGQLDPENLFNPDAGARPADAAVVCVCVRARACVARVTRTDASTLAHALCAPQSLRAGCASARVRPPCP
jgi:hypothetical protein